MTSVSATGLAALGLLRPNLFTKTDSDQSGTVSKDEFVANRPKSISESQAAELYAKIDTDGTDALTEDQLKAGLEANRPAKPAAAGNSLSSDVLSALLGLMQSLGTQESGQSHGKGRGGPPDAAEMFAGMDTDSDGTVTRAEFIAARPSNVSEKDATAFYDSIDTEGTGSITADQFAAAKPPHGGPGGPGGAGGPPPGATASDETEDDTETATTASNVSTALAKLLEAIKAYADTSNRTSTVASSLLTSALADA